MLEQTKKKIIKITKAGLIVAILGVTSLAVTYQGIAKLEKQEQNKLQATTISKEFKEISGGTHHSLAIDTSNNLWAWGYNSNGQLGNGTNTNSFQPVQIKSGTKFSKISAGNLFSLAIDTSGNLWGWGWNEYGQLANGTTTDSYIPVQIKSGTKFKEIAAGRYHCLAIDTSNNLWAWGWQYGGLLGDGSNGLNNTNSLPIQIKSGTKFSKISTSNESSFAIDTSGNLWGWGSNSSGQLGNGTTTGSTTPIQIQAGTKFSEVSTGLSHTLAIDNSGNLWAWGCNRVGELGNGGTGNAIMNGGSEEDIVQTIPVIIKGGTTFSKVTAGDSYSLAIDTDGNLWTWGLNTTGQLGNYTTANSNVPVQITAYQNEKRVGAKFTNIAAGTSHTLAIDTLNTLWSCGWNQYGQLGDECEGFYKNYYPYLIPVPRIDYPINYVLNGGTVSIEHPTYRWRKESSPLSRVTKQGYQFRGWCTDASLTSTPVWDTSAIDEGTKTYYAKFEPVQVTYKVEHYKQNERKTGYELAATDNLRELTGTNVTATPKTYTGFTENTRYSGRKATGTVAADGSLVLKLYYDRNIYNVTLNRDGGTISSGNNITSYTYGVEQTLPTLTKSGYTFAGWYTNSSFSGSPVTKISATDTGAKTYYAKWTTNSASYKVEHYQQNTAKTGYTLADTENKTGTTGQTVTGTAKTYTGFTYNQNASGTVKSGTIAANGSLVLKLYYDRSTYNVTLYKVGGTVSSGNDITSYTYGVEQTLPILTRPGYIFAGWYTDPNYTEGTEVTKISATDSGNKSYHAKWEPRTDIPYKVEYYRQNTSKTGYELVETQNKTGTTGTTAIAEVKSYTGFTYDVYNDENIKSAEIRIDGSLVLKLYYNRDTYNVTLSKNGGTISSGDDITSYTYGVGAILPILTKPGYTFDGWYTAQGTRETEISSTDTGEKSYYAKWTASGNTQYKVEYYKQNLTKNGYDKVEADSKTLTGTTGASVTAEDKAYVGFSLNGASSVRTGSIVADGSLVLRMYYDRNTYHVTLNPGDGTLPEGSENIDFTYGEEKPLPIPEKEGHNFIGWYDEDGNKVEKITQDAVGDKEYTARYEVKTYTVTFVSDGQTVGTQSVEHGKPVTAPSLTKPGYTLTWDKDLSKVTSNMTVTAIWTAGTGTEYKVEYYKQNLAKNGYDKVEADSKILVGTTGTSVTAEDKAYTGFSLNVASSVRSGNIAADGSLVLRMYYDRNTYHVTLNPGDGTLPEGSENIDFTYGEEKELPTPERPGYIFDGWYDDGGNKVDKINPDDVGDKNYHANWTAKDGTAYKIEYYHQNLAKTGYELVQTETLTGKTGDTVTVVEGKAFRGFSENKTHPNRIATGVILGDGTFTLKLYYDRSTYKITLDPGEGTLPEDSKNIDYTYGEEKELPTPERPGYIFDGWYDDDGNKVDKIKPSDAGDKNYHASWVKEDEYYITSPKYEINKEEKYIMRVSPNTAVTVFLSNIRTNGTPKVLNAKKEEVEQDSLVGTGYILQVDYKGTIYEYEIAVRGDLDGNGKVTVTDLSMLNQALVKRLELTGMRKIAGDIDYNKEVSVTDLSMMNQYFVKKIEL